MKIADIVNLATKTGRLLNGLWPPSRLLLNLNKWAKFSGLVVKSVECVLPLNNRERLFINGTVNIEKIDLINQIV